MAPNRVPVIGALRLKGWPPRRIAEASHLSTLDVTLIIAEIDEFPKRHERDIWNTLARIERITVEVEAA